MNEKKRKTTAVKFALSLITDEGRVFAVAAGENFLKLSPKRKEKWKKKMTEEEEKKKKNSMNEKENEISPSPHSFGMTNLPRRLPRNCFLVWFSPLFRGGVFSKNQQSPRAFSIPSWHACPRANQSARAVIVTRFQLIGSSATDRLLVLFWLQILPATTSSTRDVAYSMEEIALWFWHLLNRVFSNSFHGRVLRSALLFSCYSSRWLIVLRIMPPEGLIHANGENRRVSIFKNFINKLNCDIFDNSLKIIQLNVYPFIYYYCFDEIK